VEREAWAPAFQPIVLAGIELDEQAFLRHGLTAATMPPGPSGARAGQAGREEPAVDGPVRQAQAALFDQLFGEMLMIEAGVGGLGPAEDPLLECAREAVVGWPAPIAMGQGRRAGPAKGSEQAPTLAQGEAQQSRGVLGPQPTFPYFSQHFHTALLLVRQGDRPPSHTPRVTESLLIHGVTESLLIDIRHRARLTRTYVRY